ncbi:dihydropteroate synthase [Apibacter sp. B2912]|uniref:dihydropteroate synthase n=1 Tax=Apibacter sp. B2912 TaxID=2656763 RepID=UPI00136CD002|nr:dihydropteroate synthase [Apibacter sp. B2912]MXO32278.1 dihydropteroate synthase [Apibacter sp. B2912]
MTININGDLVDCNEPKVAGILNVTPDSFFDGGRYSTIDKALKQTEKLIDEGADFIDIGGQSTRPDSEFLSDETELSIVIPVIKAIKKEFPRVKLSIDTFWSKVAIESVNEGVGMINDISGGTLDNKMFETMGKLNVPYVLMHMRGTPQTMGNYTDYENIITDINYYFSKKISELRKFGVNDILLDPGFGFSKTLQQNYDLLKNIDKFKIFNLPLYIGISRKSMIYKCLETSAEEALIGTSALNLYALQKSAHILRVHDVKEAKQMIKLWKMLN